MYQFEITHGRLKTVRAFFRDKWCKLISKANSSSTFLQVRPKEKHLRTCDQLRISTRKTGYLSSMQCVVIEFQKD